MPVNVDQVLCSRARWRLRFLIPFWVVQVSILLCLMGIFAYRLVETFDHYDDAKQNGEAPMVEVVWEATNVGFSTISLVLSIIEISRMATEVLTPFLMLFTHIIKLVLAFAILGLDVTVYLQRTDKHYSIVALALDCALLAATIATFLYSVKTYRRLLKYEDYAVGGNNNNDVEFGTTTSISGGKHRSVISSHSNASTAYLSTTTDNATLKGEVDRVMSTEFGWTEGSKTKGIVVGVGVVPRSSKLESSTDLPRSQSWVTERGNATGGSYGSSYDAEEDDGTETVRDGGSPRQMHSRHGSIPTLIVSGHDDEGDEDTRALLNGNDGAR